MSGDTHGVRVLTESLGGSLLSRAAQERRLPAPIQPWWPQSAAEWSAHVARVRASAAAGWLEALRPAMQPSGEALERLTRAANGGVVVTTGQQAGLFGGPLYTLSKALSALAFADALQQRLGVPVAPVFWAATDDADFLEAAEAWVASAEGVHRIVLDGSPPAGTPMASAPLGDTRELLRQLHRACGSSAHERYFEMARVAFSGRHTMGDAYVELLRQLLQPLGIAVLDASHPVVRARAMPLLHRALERAGDVHDAVAATSQAIRAAGFEPQVDDERGLSLVFSNDGGVKRRLSVDEARAAGSTAHAVSPNVLLRPVVERAILPTVGYVAGPGELAYFAQVAGVAHALDAATPVGLPRWSGTVIEPFTARALSRLGVEAAEAANVHALEKRFAQAAVPPEVAEAWARLQRQIGESVSALGEAVRASALLPMPVIEGLRRSLEHKLGRAERRLLAAAKRRDDQARRDIALVSGALYPNGKRQERVLNFVPMLARSGDDLLAAMLAAARAHADALVPAGRGEPASVR